LQKKLNHCQPNREEQRYDYQYERTCNLFMFFEPLGSWRHVEVTRNAAIDYAHQMKYLVDEMSQCQQNYCGA